MNEMASYLNLTLNSYFNLLSLEVDEECHFINVSLKKQNAWGFGSTRRVTFIHTAEKRLH